MALSTTNVGDNPWVPGVTQFDYLPDQLIAGHHNLVTQPIVLGAGTLKRGTVLGQTSAFSLTSTPGTNTGTGTIGSLSPGAAPETGAVYTLTATNATTFTVVDPEGVSLANATVGTPYASNEVNFTITAGGTAFAAGDNFKLTYTTGVGTYIASVKTASDGSQTPVAILADDTDASGGPQKTGAYVAGEFNVNAVIADSSWNGTTLTPAMRAFGIFLKASISAADPLF